MIRLAPRNHWSSDLLVILLSYELAALTTGRLPTLTEIQRRWRIIGPLFIAGLAVHFYAEDEILKRVRGSEA